ncbi:ABC transporter permease [Bacillaceae bacterium S4-13-58]
MSKFWIILCHTYTSTLKSKGFIATTIITILLIIGLTNLQSIMDSFSDGEENNRKVAVIDDTGAVFDSLSQQVAIMTEDELQVVSYSEDLENGKEAVKSGEYDGLLHVTLDNQQVPQATYYAMQIAENQVSNQVQQALQQVKVSVATQAADLDPQTIQQIFAPVSFEKSALQDNAKTEEELTQARGLVYIILFLIYFAVLMYGNMIAMEVAKEKASRVMEILISSAPPVLQMFAKIFGVALIGLTQFLAIILTGYFSLRNNQSELTGGYFEYFGVQDLDVSIFVYAVVFFLLGYLLYATLAAMLGSLVSRIEDAQQIITPMTLLVVAGFMISMFGLNMPESTFVTITSYIPFFAPMIMFLRVGMLDVPIWEVALSIGILIGTITLFAWIGARVYRGGVLLYGASSSLKDFKQALSLSKKD